MPNQLRDKPAARPDAGPGRGRTRPGCACDRRQRVLLAAVHAFARSDFHQVRTDDIAAAAGVAKGTIFRYFATKEDLFVAALVHSAEETAAHLDQACHGIVGPQERLRAAVERLAAFYQQNRHHFRLLHSEKSLAEQPRHAEFHSRQNGLRGRIAAILRDGQAAGIFRPYDADTACALLFGMFRTAMRSDAMKQRPAQEIAALVMDLFLHGICPPAGR